VWGDTHTKVFDVHSTHYYPITWMINGDYWLVKSGHVWIQARYEATTWVNGRASMHGIAIGGPFLDHKNIIVGPHRGKMYFNNKEISNAEPTFNVPGFFTATLHDHGVRLSNGVRQPVHSVTLRLPLGVVVVVYRWPKHIDAIITMSPMNTQDGHCGNFNGYASDDTKVKILARLPGQVSREHDLFPPTHFNTETPKPFSVKDCPPERLKEAQLKCPGEYKHASSAQVSSCVLDVCLHGIQWAAKDAATQLSAGR
jgi:hypothetical protein